MTMRKKECPPRSAAVRRLIAGLERERDNARARVDFLTSELQESRTLHSTANERLAEARRERDEARAKLTLMERWGRMHRRTAIQRGALLDVAGAERESIREELRRITRLYADEADAALRDVDPAALLAAR